MPKVEIPAEVPGTSGARRAALRHRGENPREMAEASLRGTSLAWGGGDYLHGLAIVSTILDEMIGREVTARREAPADSWATIGASLGITKQAAQQRYGVKAS